MLTTCVQRKKIDGPKFSEMTFNDFEDMGVDRATTQLLIERQQSLTRAALYVSNMDLTRRSMTYAAPNAPTEEWDTYAVRNWLMSEGFVDIADLFLSHQIDGIALLQLQLEDVRAMGVDDDTAVRLLRRVDTFDELSDLAGQDDDMPPVRVREMTAS